MMKEILYSHNEGINNKIRQKHYIPYLITNKGIKYEANRWYYNAYWGQFLKVISVKYDRYNVLQECYIKWEDDLYGLICTDLEIGSDYKIQYDHREIYKEEIINSDKVYTGAEIIYWFFMNNINCFNKKYKGFWRYIDNSSDHRIQDFNKYKITGNIDQKGNYINCKIIRIK